QGFQLPAVERAASQFAPPPGREKANASGPEPTINNATLVRPGEKRRAWARWRSTAWAAAKKVQVAAPGRVVGPSIWKRSTGNRGALSVAGASASFRSGVPRRHQLQNPALRVEAVSGRSSSDPRAVNNRRGGTRSGGPRAAVAGRSAGVRSTY